MTTHEAHEILGLRPGAGPDERLAAYQKQREMLEVKLGRSPTPGLKTKYRGALERLDEAYEVLELADDPGDLPALRPPQIDLPHVKQLAPSQQVTPLPLIQEDVPPPPEPRPPVMAEESEPEPPSFSQPLASRKKSPKAMFGFVVLSVALAAGGVAVWQKQAKESEALRIAEAADSARAKQEDATRAAEMVKLAEATKKAENEMPKADFIKEQQAALNFQEFEQELDKFDGNGDFEGALRFVEKALAENGFEGEEKIGATLSKAMIQFALDKKAEALKTLDEAKSIDPNNELVGEIEKLKKVISKLETLEE